MVSHPSNSTGVLPDIGMASTAGVSSKPENHDVVIIGAGPVGLLLAVCLARWGYKVKQVDNRERPTLTGRADGIQPRSLHLLRNMDLKRQIMAYGPAKSYEVAFWEPNPSKAGIYRTKNLPSCPESIDARYPFTVTLHQGFIERVFIEDLHKNRVDVQRPWAITGFKNHGDLNYPVEVNLHQVQTGEAETVRAKYLFSGEGARSFVRERLGIKVHHKDPVAHVWGVIDGLVRTDFPDIKMKCTVHSDHGSIMTIPRENNLVRLYIQLSSSTDRDWNPRKQVSPMELQESARKILQPYFIEWDHVEWYSIYPIKQGLAEKYTIDHRIFMGGDCCHTHSPKAGQGMNTAFHDALNLAWKIHHVEAGFARRSILYTYELERKKIAEDLLEFDAKYAALFSRRNSYAAEHDPVSQDGRQAEDAFVELFKISAEFASGYGIAYGPNDFNWSSSHPARSHLFNPKGSKMRIGHVMPAIDVTRVVDVNKVQLEQVVPLNGSFRIYIFAGNPSSSRLSIADFTSNLQKKESFYSVFQHPDLATVSYHERHNPHSMLFTICIIFATSRINVNIAQLLPPLLAQYRYHIYADDIPNPKFPEAKYPAYSKLGIDEQQGCVLVVRPDGHVGCVVGLEEGSGTVDALNDYFGAFVSKAIGTGKAKAAS